jgi:putative oxidoreductase
MLNRPLPAPARDIALLIGRIVLGGVLFAHGWKKLMIDGIAGTHGQFEKLGIPLAIFSASFTSFVEFVGGALLIVGALTTTVIALDLVVMVGAAGFVHLSHGILAQNGRWELVGVIVAAELALAATGPGRFSVDHLICSLRARREMPPAPAPSASGFDWPVERTPQRGGVAARFTRLAADDTGPVGIRARPTARFTPRTATQPTVAQQAAMAKVAARTGRPEVAPPAPAGEPAAVASLFEPSLPTAEAQAVCGSRPPVESPQPVVIEVPPTSLPAPIPVQDPGELPKRVRRTERVAP